MSKKPVSVLKSAIFLYDSVNQLHISRSKYGDIAYSRDGYTWSDDLHTVLDVAPEDTEVFPEERIFVEKE